MQLKQRIKKIEEKISSNNSGSEFCACYGKCMLGLMKEIYDAHETGREKNFSKIHPAPDFKSNLCNICGKTIKIADIKFHENAKKQYDAHETIADNWNK